MIDSLSDRYDVSVDEGLHLTADLPHPGETEGIARAVRLTPNAEGCAPIVFILWDFPSVTLHAGALFETTHPSCGCNACDETWDSEADELEWQTLAVVDGRLSERVGDPRRPTWSFDWGRGIVKGTGQSVKLRIRSRSGDRASGSEREISSLPAPVVARVLGLLDRLAEHSPEGTWKPWPLREPSG